MGCVAVVHDTRHFKGHIQNKQTHNVNAHHTDASYGINIHTVTHAPWDRPPLPSKRSAAIQVDPLLLSLAAASAPVAIIMQGKVSQSI